MKPLDLDALQRLLDVHGAVAAQWPDHLRTAALVRIATDPSAARMLDAAAHLDLALLRLPEPELPGRLASRILAAVPAERGSWWQTLRQLWQELGGYRLAGPVLACGLLAGIVPPLLQDVAPTSGDTADLINVAQLGDEQWQITDLDTTP